MRKEPGRTDHITLDEMITRVIILGDPHGEMKRLTECLWRAQDDETAIFCVGDAVGYEDGPKSSMVCRILRDWKLPTVFGNHERWMCGRRLYIVMPPATNYFVEEDAFRWIATLPYRIIVTTPRWPGKSIHIQHSAYDYSNEDWLYIDDEISPQDALAREPEADVLCTGHTHRPALFEVDAKNSVRKEKLMVRTEDAKSMPVIAGRKYILDAGSIGRPGGEKDLRQLDVGSYGVIDLSGPAPVLSVRTIRDSSSQRWRTPAGC